MIQSFRHKGLRNFFESATLAGIQEAHAKRLRELLEALDRAQFVEQLARPGFGLHPLRGPVPTRWSLRVSANWRLTFEFDEGTVRKLDYEDYH